MVWEEEGRQGLCGAGAYAPRFRAFQGCVGMEVVGDGDEINCYRD